jgi:hypothetical protein
MNSLPHYPEWLQRALQPTERGVVGLVEDLLGACREGGVRLDWRADRCQVRPLGAGPQESTEAPLPKSVFRAILARMAALCNERSPNSVSPYGGEGDVSVGADPPTLLHVAFANTPGEQWLEVRCVEEGDNEVKEFTVLLQATTPSDPPHVVKVRGRRLKRIPPLAEGESSMFGILSKAGDEDVYAALFPSGSVLGVFCGEVRLGGKDE